MACIEGTAGLLEGNAIFQDQLVLYLSFPLTLSTYGWCARQQQTTCHMLWPRRKQVTFKKGETRGMDLVTLEEGPLFGDDKLNASLLKIHALGNLKNSVSSADLMDWNFDDIFTEERFKCLLDDWIATIPLENGMTMHFDVFQMRR